MALTPLAGFTPRTPRVAAFADSGIVATHTMPLNADLATLSYDPKLVASIERRRRLTAERNERMLRTPRLARIGIDIAGLDAQMEVKRANAEAEAKADQTDVDKMARISRLFNEHEDSMRQRKHDQQKECIEFSLTHLSKDKRREAFLSDPNELKKDKVPGMDSSISSIQQFSCEATGAAHYIKQQKTALQEFLEGQMIAKKERENYEKEVDRQLGQAEFSANQVRDLCERAAVQERLEETRHYAEENKKISDVMLARKQGAIDRRAAEEKRHVAHAMAHNTARERHDYSIGREGQKMDCKRCTIEEAGKALRENAVLVYRTRSRGDDEKQRDLEHLKVGVLREYCMDAADVINNESRLNRRLKLDEDNFALSRKKKEMDELLRKNYKSFEIDLRL